MLAQMSGALWQEWQAYMNLEPFGGHGEDIRTNFALFWQSRFAGMMTKQKKPMDFDDFRPYWMPKRPMHRPSRPTTRAGRRELARQQQKMLMDAFSTIVVKKGETTTEPRVTP